MQRRRRAKQKSQSLALFCSPSRRRESQRRRRSSPASAPACPPARVHNASPPNKINDLFTSRQQRGSLLIKWRAHCTLAAAQIPRARVLFRLPRRPTDPPLISGTDLRSSRVPPRWIEIAAFHTQNLTQEFDAGYFSTSISLLAGIIYSFGGLTKFSSINKLPREFV